MITCGIYKIVARIQNCTPQMHVSLLLKISLPEVGNTPKSLMDELQTPPPKKKRKKVAILRLLKLFSHFFCNFLSHEPQYVL